MHEERFSGLKRTPNALQIKWTMYNIALDNDRNLDEVDGPPEEFTDVPDYYFYELSKAGMSIADMSKKMNIKEEVIEERLQHYMEVAAAFRPVKDKLDKKMAKAGSAYKHRRSNIG